MLAINGGIKYQGFSVSTEFYLRWVELLEATSAIADPSLFDTGFYVKSSYMLIDETLMLYGYHSRINGEFGGDTWDLGVGLNWYVVQNRGFRFNPEFIYASNSPVGYLSYPIPVGANGPAFVLNLEIMF